MKKMLVRKIPLIVAIGALGIVAVSGAVMLLWNGILPAVLHTGTITLWQAAGLLLLSKILFSGFRGRHHMGGRWKNKAMMMKWRNMTPEEQAQLREKGCYGKWQHAGC